MSLVRRPRHQLCDDHGVVLVEFAMVLPILMMLMLGMFSGGMAWNQNQSMGQGARVAARYASTLPLPATDPEMDAWLDGIADQAVAASDGAMAADVGGRAVCVAYVDPAGSAPDHTFSRRINAAGTRSSATSVCFADGQSTTQKRVQVLLERNGTLDIGLTQQTFTLRRTVVYRYEADSGL